MAPESKTGFQMRNVLFVLLILLVSTLYSCSANTRSLSQDEVPLAKKVKMTDWKKIAVLPFSGDPLYRRVSTELFSYYLQEQVHFELIGPAISEIALKKRGIVNTEALIGNKEIFEMAEILGADAVIVGTVKIEEATKTAFSYVGVGVGTSLVDVKTGKIMAQGGMAIAGDIVKLKLVKRTNKIFDNAKEATRISAYQILAELYKLAGDPREFDILIDRPLSTDEGELSL